ncbi:hypothetical protein ACL6C3_13770 [Capilliphycus salinus ALCB114379]|uniref:hypothetical protein n=1 Tax=Capilliphycus salinus TaxID=2768948 RepID=UPI002BC721B6|nr:hypothetical protein [Lyngbya sp.]
MNSTDKQAIKDAMNQSPNGNGNGKKATERPQQNSSKTSSEHRRTSIADAMGLNETERELVGLTSDLKSKQMLRLVESETLRKFGEGLQESGGLIENLNTQLEALQSYEFTLEDAAFLLSGQPLTHVKMLSGSEG